jgi:hypothetical protein
MIILLDPMGGVALLLWGVHRANTGVIRAFGAEFRRILGRALRSRWRAFAAGVGITAVLQSSTATALLTSSLAARGIVDLVPERAGRPCRHAALAPHRFEAGTLASIAASQVLGCREYPFRRCMNP